MKTDRLRQTLQKIEPVSVGSRATAKTAIDEWIFGFNPPVIYTLNMVLQALTRHRWIDPGMELRHSYYLYFTEELCLEPEAPTFSHWLSGILSSNPPRYKFISFIVTEMERFNIVANQRIVRTILHLCARFPTPSNVQSAASWFDCYLRRKHDAVSTRQYLHGAGILSAYLSVVVEGKDRERAEQIRELSRLNGLWNKAMHAKYEQIIKSSTSGSRGMVRL